MIVGIFQWKGHLYAHSLKDKRSMMKRLLERTRQRYSISIAETAFQDSLTETEIGFALVANSRPLLERQAEKILKSIEHNESIEFYDLYEEYIYI